MRPLMTVMQYTPANGSVLAVRPPGQKSRHEIHGKSYGQQGIANVRRSSNRRDHAAHDAGASGEHARLVSLGGPFDKQWLVHRVYRCRVT